MKDANSFLRFNKYWLTVCARAFFFAVFFSSVCRTMFVVCTSNNRTQHMWYVSPSSPAQRQQGRHISAKNREQQLTCIIHLFCVFFFYFPANLFINWTMSNEMESNEKHEGEKKQWKNGQNENQHDTHTHYCALLSPAWLSICAAEAVCIVTHNHRRGPFNWWINICFFDCKTGVEKSCNSSIQAMLSGDRLWMDHDHLWGVAWVCSLNYRQWWVFSTQTKCQIRENERNFIWISSGNALTPTDGEKSNRNPTEHSQHFDLSRPIQLHSKAYFFSYRNMHNFICNSVFLFSSRAW